AVDVEDVLRPRRAVDGDRRLPLVLGVGVGGDAGGDLYHRRVVAPGGEVLDGPVVEVAAQGRRGGVDDRRLAGDGDLLRRAGAQDGVDQRLAVEPDGDLAAGLDDE